MDRTPFPASMESLEGRQLFTAFFGLTTGNALVRFDSNSPGTVSQPLAITGLDTGDILTSIDTRRKTGDLVGFTNTGKLYVLDTYTGAASQILGIGSTRYSSLVGGALAYNTVLDTVRLTAPSGVNLRFHLRDVDRGGSSLFVGATTEDNAPLTYAGGDSGAGATPTLADIAYGGENDLGAAAASQGKLFGLDLARGVLVTQATLADKTGYQSAGELVTVGSLMVDSRMLSLTTAALEVVGEAADASGTLPPPAGYVLGGTSLSGPETLYTVNLDTGALTPVGDVATTVQLRDFALDVGSVLSGPAEVSASDGKVSFSIRRSNPVGSAHATFSFLSTFSDTPTVADVVFVEGQQTATISFASQKYSNVLYAAYDGGGVYRSRLAIAITGETPPVTTPASISVAGLASTLAAGQRPRAVIKLLGSAGQLDRGSGDKVGVTLHNAAGTIIGAASVNQRTGQLNYNGVALKIAGIYTLSVSSNLHSSATQTITVFPGPLQNLTVAVPTASFAANTPFAATVTARDRFGNLVTTSTATLDLILRGKRGVTLTGNTQAILAAGVADFSDLAIATPGPFRLFATGVSAKVLPVKVIVT